MKLYGYIKCSTCKKAIKSLEKCEFIDIIEKPLSYEEIKYLYEKSNLDIKKFFNTSGIYYREQNIKDKLEKMNLEEKLKLLSSNGYLVKRPILLTDKDEVIVGYNEEKYTNLKV